VQRRSSSDDVPRKQKERNPVLKKHHSTFERSDSEFHIEIQTKKRIKWNLQKQEYIRSEKIRLTWTASASISTPLSMAARPSTPNLICLAKVRVAPTLREALLCREERETARLVFAEADSIMVKEEFKNEVFSNEIMNGNDDGRTKNQTCHQQVPTSSLNRNSCLLLVLPRHPDMRT
jgi:hypothetical protein